VYARAGKRGPVADCNATWLSHLFRHLSRWPQDCFSSDRRRKQPALDPPAGIRQRATIGRKRERSISLLVAGWAFDRIFRRPEVKTNRNGWGRCSNLDRRSNRPWSELEQRGRNSFCAIRD